MIARFWPLLFSLAMLFLCIIVNPFSHRHQMWNLEPYPDGLFYVVTAQQVGLGHGLTMPYQGTVLKPKVPPAYALMLSPFFAIFQDPRAFYFGNVVLAIVSVVFLFQALRNITTNTLVQSALLLTYVFHGYIDWFVTLPMAENLSLALCAITLWSLTVKKANIYTVTCLTTAAAGLILTKYVNFPFAAGAVIWQMWQLYKHKQYKEILLVVNLGAFWGILFLLFLGYINFNPLIAFTTSANSSATSSTFLAFDLSRLWPTVLQYLKMIFGQRGTVLWQTLTLSTLGISLVAVVVVLLASRVKIWRNRGWMFVLLGISPLAMLQLFYVVDGRYFFTVVPCFILAIAYFIGEIQKVRNFSRNTLTVCLLAVILGIQVFSQIPLFKQLFVTNILQRSTAWQYEAVIELSSKLDHQPESYLITTLPPYFVSLYQSSPFLTLPLSQHQEFLDKQQYVWGSDLNYQDLPALYAELLVQGKTVFITNAYISHNAKVIDDYESLKSKFAFIPVSSGCIETCNLYQLKPLVTKQ